MDYWIAFGLLTLLGLRMIRETIGAEPGTTKASARGSYAWGLAAPPLPPASTRPPPGVP